MKRKVLARLLALFLSVILVFSFSLASLADESGLTSIQSETTEDILTGTEATNADLEATNADLEATDAELNTDGTEEEKGIPLINNLISLLSASIGTYSYNGSTDISEAAVDSITIGGSGVKDDGSVNAYVNFTVTVSFSEDDASGNQKSGLDIESGDTITVSWEAPAGVTFTGYTGTINLYQNDDSSGTLLGTAVVTTDGVTITFNDNVTDLQHVTGSVTFTIKNYGNTTSESGGTGTITSGNVTTNVTINHSTATGIGAFGAKGGAYYTNDENKIDWWFWINGKEASDLTGEIVITDTLPDTETFDSFTSFALRNGGSWNWGVYNLDDFNSKVGQFVYDDASKTVTIKIPKSFVTEHLNGTAAVLHFTTTSTAVAGTKVRNTATWEYYEDGSSDKKNESHTGTLTVPTTSGTISGIPKGTIQITKVVNGTTDPIEGVTFRVYQVVTADETSRVTGWYNGSDYAEIVTGSSGIATLGQLNDGYYEIEEIADNLPNWIASSSLPDSVYVTIGGSAGTATTIPNSVKTDTITATKNWTQSDGTTADTSDEARTVYFLLYRDGTALTDEDLPDDQTAIQAVVTAAGASSAEVSWENLPLYDNTGKEYTYTVKEVDADGNDDTPYGYTKEESGLTVTNIRSKDSQEESSSLTLQKTDADGNVLSGAVFTLYDGDDAVKTYSAGTAVISSDDLVTVLGDDESKTFTLKETTAPSGYQLNTTEYEITLTKKVTEEWAGTAADLKYTTVTTYTLSSDAAVNGTIKVVDNPTSDDDSSSDDRSSSDGSSSSGSSSSSSGSSSSGGGGSSSGGSSSYSTGSREESSVINIRKTDDNGNLLSGAEFTLYNGDTVVGTYTAGETSISSDDLKNLLGDDDTETFTLRETKAPDGYVAEDKVYSITLTRDVTRQWEGSGSSRRYMTVTSYTFSSDDAVDGTLQIVNSLSSSGGTVAGSPMRAQTGEAGNYPDSAVVRKPYVRTGDESHTVLWAIVSTAALISLLVYFIRKRNKNRR